MHDQSGNEEHLNNVPVKPKVDVTSQDNENKDVPSTSNSEFVAKAENEVTSLTKRTVEDKDFSSNQVDKNQSKMLIEDSSEKTEIICMDRIIGKIEPVKQKAFKLPTESEGVSPSSGHEVVGDDFTKKSEIHIVCECEPNVAGAAVPTVKSFIPTDHQQSLTKCDKSNCKVSANDLIENNTCTDSFESQVLPDIKEPKPIEDEEKVCSNAVNNKKCQQNFKLTMEKSSSEIKFSVKKPSLIPKPTRPATGNCKILDKDDNEKRETVTQLRGKFDPQKNVTKSSSNGIKMKETKIAHYPKNGTRGIHFSNDKHLESSRIPSNANTISSRMIGLQERLKATTSMLRQKIEMDRGKEKSSPEENCVKVTIEEDTNQNVPSPNKKTIDELYKNISCLKNIASVLSENNTLKNQTKYIEKLFRNISEIKSIADRLCCHDPSKSKHDVTDEVVEKEKSPKSSPTNAKDNKIYIKFMHSKDRKSDSRKKIKDMSPEQSEEVQTDLALGSKLTSDSLNSDTCIVEKNQEENKIRETDSMDGVFIPSCEPPMNMDDDDETNGLDITITFPEFSQLYSNGAESHLSVCLSDISAEALKKLKRCPKDFTLRMDFVEGKVLFQSGKGPANNFQIGPDLKFAENIVDSKKSDVISIKPSTECSFGSQLIPVESPRENKSFRSLKSADSELFTVVSLPFLYRNPYLATNHKSCITLRNDHIMSMAILAKHIYKSMPQIPSLTNIFEDKIMESPSKTDSRQKAQKSSDSKEME